MTASRLHFENHCPKETDSKSSVLFQTNKASAEGDLQGANAASRQALWLSVLSIVFGIVTYICAIAALISYLSAKPP